ncbi:MAG: hypothetical protein JWL97_4318 [Gemmatimonadales bacterium]|nr:hypothetical protein [Gemmatimonadales bacterium]
MNNDRELIHAAMRWHLLQSHRAALNAVRRKMEKEIWPNGSGYAGLHPLYSAHGDVKVQITATKQKERAALRLLAKACAKQRGHFDLADVIDLDGAVRLLPCT